MRLVLFVVTAAVALTTGLAWADGVVSTVSCSKAAAERECSFSIKISGLITSSTLDEVKKALAERKEMMRREGEQNDWWIIHVDSRGGSVAAAVAIGRLFRSLDAPIAVDPDEACLSSCVFVLAGATHRLIYGRVGIHRPFLETDVDVGTLQSRYRNMTEGIRSYLREMNISDRLADDMMVVPPEKVRFLSVAELAGYGLQIIDPVTEESTAIQEARKLGIGRIAYMERRELSESLCKIANPNGTRTYVLSQACVSAVLSGRHVERAPPCRNGAVTCQAWERAWNGRKLDAKDVVTGDGFLISGGA
jgi:hypothetical protein